MKKIIFLFFYFLSFSYANTVVVGQVQNTNWGLVEVTQIISNNPARTNCWASDGLNPSYGGQAVVNGGTQYSLTYRIPFGPDVTVCESTSYYAIADYHCPDGKTFIDGSCQCPPIGSYYNKISPVADEASCNMSNPLLVSPDGFTIYVSSVEWNSCRNECLAHTESCPCGQAIVDGSCRAVEPPIGSCNTSFECFTRSLGVNESSTCTLECYCGDSLNRHM